jgi:signal transduction histidine kinase
MRRVIAVAYCLREFGLALVALPVFAVALVLAALTGPTLGPVLAAGTRWLPNLSRGFGGIERPYRPRPAGPPSWAWYRAWASRVWSDPATWRDFLWLLTEPVLGGLLLLPGVAAVFGLVGLALPGAEGWLSWFWNNDPSSRAIAVVSGLGLLAAGLALAPMALRAHARWCAVLLAPTEAARHLLERERLARRVRQLTETRADAADAQADELRRIERDLHDGAQARLAAVAITLGAAEQLLDADPETARELYTKARRSTQTALDELRDLVNGIHPPVLAERGITDALRALVLDLGLRVSIRGEVPGRVPAPVESAVYFAVSELLANAVKHAGDVEVRIGLGHAGGVLRAVVEDDGPGGADEAKGTGLAGIGRRLGVFDGTLSLSSPVGGPTTATLEIPCESSSPKTTNC